MCPQIPTFYNYKRKDVIKMSLEKKIRWFFEHVKKEITVDDLELLKLGFFDNDGNIVFQKPVVSWRSFNEFLDKKQH